MKPWIVFFLFTPLLLAHPMPGRESNSEESSSIPPLTPIRVEGVLRLTGNEPFTRLGLSDSQGTFYYLEAGPKDPIRSYIGSAVIVKGVLKRTPIRLADDHRLPDELSIVQYEWEPLAAAKPHSASSTDPSGGSSQSSP